MTTQSRSAVSLPDMSRLRGGGAPRAHSSIDKAGLASVTRLLPLVARPRPHTGPLTRRIDAVDQMSREAHAVRDPVEAVVTATRALGRAAMVAEDCGALDLARQLCQSHLRAYVEPARRLTAPQAARMLGPGITLARLHGLESGPGQVVAGLRLLLHAVHGLVPVRIGDARLPLGNVLATPEERRTLEYQVRTHLLVGGITAETAVGRWSAAADLAETYDRASSRLLEGQQAMIVDRIMRGDMPAACRVIDACEPRQAWEQQVRDCLTVLCVPPARRGAATREMLDRYDARTPVDDGDVGFRIRLALLVASIACLSSDLKVRRAGEDIAHRVVTDACDLMDGHAARDVLRHPLVRVATGTEQVYLARVVARSGLAGGALIGRARTRVLDAATHAQTVLEQAS